MVGFGGREAAVMRDEVGFGKADMESRYLFAISETDVHRGRYCRVLVEKGDLGRKTSE